MEEVSYARCGLDDIVTLKKDGTVWTWEIMIMEIVEVIKQIIFQNRRW